MRRLTEAGAGTVVLQPTADEPDPEGFVRFAAEEVRPLLPDPTAADPGGAGKSTRRLAPPSGILAA